MMGCCSADCGHRETGYGAPTQATASRLKPAKSFGSWGFAKQRDLNDDVHRYKMRRGVCAPMPRVKYSCGMATVRAVREHESA